MREKPLVALVLVSVALAATVALVSAQSKPTPRPLPRKPVQASAPPVSNPVALEFEFSDWAQATGYQVDIIDAETLAVKQTLRFNAQPAVAGTNTLHLPVNVQPVAHGLYAFVARAVLPDSVSPSSEPSDPWQRLPGPPGKPVAIGK